MRQYRAAGQQRIEVALAGRSWEVLFVDDDSPDGTAAAVRQTAATRSNVRCLSRVGRRGLTSACLEGFAATQGRFIGVMDADLQHDESLLPRMLDILEAGEAELVVASRYAAGGSTGDFPCRAASSAMPAPGSRGFCWASASATR
jgi:dolichol-phosphate mannosyltransferase